MHFTDYQVDRGCLCDECETAPYQQQHAFALSNSEQSPSLWIHFSDAVVYSILSLFFPSYTIFASIFHNLLNDLTATIRDYMRIHVELCLSTRVASPSKNSRRTGFEIRLALASALRATVYRILMKIDCFDKDNDAGNNVCIQVRRRRCIDTDRYRVQT